MTDGSGMGTTRSIIYMCRPSGPLGKGFSGSFFVPFFHCKTERVSEITGYIHSIESMGLVDGPGVRGVVFLQGCPLRCSYCHNPDTWNCCGGEKIEANWLVQKLLRFRSYYERSGGGVTISGGDPLCQKEFLIEVLGRLKDEGIHTCLDTAGSVPGDWSDVLAATDLILYDVKHWQAEGYHALTGGNIAVTQDFVRQAQERQVPLWVRHVVVPGITDGAMHMERLQAYIATLSNVERVELLPYHRMGAHKYAALGIEDKLEGTAPMDKVRCAQLQDQYFEEVKTQTAKESA